MWQACRRILRAPDSALAVGLADRVDPPAQHGRSLPGQARPGRTLAVGGVDGDVQLSEPERLAKRREPVFPASQQVIASAVTGPTPYSRAARTLASARCLRHPAAGAQLLQPGLQGAGHLQRGGDLRLPGRGQIRGRGRPQPGQVLLGAQRALAQGRGALVEQDRVDPLHPGRVLGPQVVIGLQQCQAFQDVTGCGSSPPGVGPWPATSAGADGQSYLLRTNASGLRKGAHPQVKDHMKVTRPVPGRGDKQQRGEGR